MAKVTTIQVTKQGCESKVARGVLGAGVPVTK